MKIQFESLIVIIYQKKTVKEFLNTSVEINENDENNSQK